MPNTRTVNLYPKPTPGVAAMEKLSVTTASNNPGQKFATTYSSLTRYIVLDVQDADAFVTYTDENPGGTNGAHRLYAGRSYTWDVATAKAAEFTKAGSTTSIIQASEFTD
tara:strand:+ start:189 stop:518 length:330 start_codon:yes stop_codon:yes gene_type:complete